MIKFSAIVTTFNSELFIQRTIDSLLNQNGLNTDFELELIVVDDCSIDGTCEILKKNNIEFHITTGNSGGPNRGRNIGLKLATGDYICIIDHDDEWKEDRLLKTLPHINEGLILTSGYTISDISTGKEIDRCNVNKDGFIKYVANATFKAKLQKSLSGQISYMGSIVFHKSLKDTFFEEIYGMIDFDWILRLFHQKESVEICDSLYIRHIDGSNLSLNDTYRKRDFYYSLMTIEEYQNEYPKETRKAYNRIHGSRARYYYLIGNMRKSRFYFIKSEWSLKTLAYYLTTFFGSELVKKKFNVFG